MNRFHWEAYTPRSSTMCDQCRLVKYARVLPYHCQCGEVHWGDAEPPPRQPRKPHPRTVGSALREMVGCGCRNLPWKKWDRLGLDWCREHADQIAARLAREPNTGLDSDRAAELVRLAIEVAERAR